jgi:hypothetical protein
LVTPCGELFFSTGVNVVDGGAEARQIEGRTHYYWGSFQPDLQRWAAAARRRLQDWGFNTIGAWSLPPRPLKMPSVIDLAVSKHLELPLGRTPLTQRTPKACAVLSSERWHRSRAIPTASVISSTMRLAGGTGRC